MVLIIANTNLPEDKFTSQSATAKEIVASVAKHFDIKPEHIVLSFHAGAMFWFRESDAPLFNIEVVAAESMMTAENVENAISLITKAINKYFPEVPEDRILIFIRSHDPNHAGINGKTMASYYAGL
ncbi:uncharacterized protein LOC142354652 [Convolutriloba macropyga]|uniref:uncharacterized protein LOC142354652 n=1 Tax=Convolutriloba macropyga TaxID=536237 RepID=UPI003F528875